jgi:DNA-binding beta-propeller fold protein YncE
MLKNKSRFPPIRSIPALVSLLLALTSCGDDPYVNVSPEYAYSCYGIQADSSVQTRIGTYVWNYTDKRWEKINSMGIPDITPADQTTLTPSGGSGASARMSRAVRAATSTTSGSSTIVYILDKFGNLVQFDPSSSTFVATLNFSQAVTQGIAQRFAVTPDRHFAFITVNSAQTAMSTGYVLVADLTSFSIVSTIPLPAATVVGGIAITPDGSLAYVVTQPYSGSGPSVVYVINVASRAITTTIPFTGYSNLGQIAITPDGTEAYLVDSIDGGDFSIQVLDLQSNTLEPPVSIYYGSGKNLMEGYPPSYLALHPDGTRLYLAPVSGGPVIILSTITKTVTNTIPLAAGAGPVFGAQPTFTPDGIHLAFTSGMNLVVFVNTLTDTVESSITLPPPPFEPIRNFSFFFTPNP